MLSPPPGSVGPSGFFPHKPQQPPPAAPGQGQGQGPGPGQGQGRGEGQAHQVIAVGAHAPPLDDSGGGAGDDKRVAIGSTGDGGLKED
jgi:hypothetical protein